MKNGEIIIATTIIKVILTTVIMTVIIIIIIGIEKSSCKEDNIKRNEIFVKPCFIGTQKSQNVNIENKVQETKTGKQKNCCTFTSF